MYDAGRKTGKEKKRKRNSLVGDAGKISHMYMYVRTYVCMYVCMCVCIKKLTCRRCRPKHSGSHACVCVDYCIIHIYTHIHTYICTHTYTYIHIYIYIYMNMFVYKITDLSAMEARAQS